MRRVTAATLMATTIAGFGLAMPSHSLAAPQAATDVRAARRATAESIAAQYAAEQFRAARIGDENTQRLLAENDAHRRRIAAVLKDVRATAAQRDAARAQLTVLDTQLKEVNTRLLASQQTGDELKAQLREYQRQITDAVDTASPEVAAAYELYAAGDRDTAYEVIDRLSQVEAAAAKRAGEIRAGALMRRPAVLAMDRKDRGEMTLLQVIGAWERAQAADPSNWRGWTDLTNLQIDASRLPEAKASAEKGVLAAQTDDQKAVSLGQIGEVLIAQGDASGGRDKLDEALALLKRVTAPWGDAPPASEEQVEVWRSVMGILDRQGDLLTTQLVWGPAADIYAEELKICRRIAAFRTDNIRSQRDLEVCLAKIATAHQAAGEPAKAREAREELLTIARKVLATNPQNLAFRREAAMAMLQLSEDFNDNGDRARARPLAVEGLAHMRALHAADPENALAQRDLAVGLIYDAVTLEPTAATLKPFREQLEQAVALRRALATAQPTNAAVQRDLAWCLEKLAEGLAVRGDLPGALKAATEEVAAFRRVAALPTADGYDQRRVGKAVNFLARVTEAALGEPAARPHYEEALVIHRKLAEENPTSSLVQADLGSLLTTMGDVRFRANDKAGAQRYYEEALAATYKANALDKSNRYVARNAGVLLVYLADAALDRGDDPAVTKYYDDALYIFQQLVKAYPNDPEMTGEYGRTLYRWASLNSNRDVYVEAVKYLELAERHGRLDDIDRRHLATAREKVRTLPPPPPRAAPPPAAAPTAPAAAPQGTAQ